MCVCMYVCTVCTYILHAYVRTCVHALYVENVETVVPVRSHDPVILH